MFELKYPKSLFGIKEGMYVAIDNKFEKIINTSSSSEKAFVELENGKELEITKFDLELYTFAELNDVNPDIGVDMVYHCKVCSNPTLVFETREQVEKHIDTCLFNPMAQSCVMCKHLKIIENPPYPRFAKDYKSIETYHAFGAYKQPYCMKKDKNISEWVLFENHDDCYEFSDEPPVTETTEEFDKYVELIMSDDVYTEEVDINELDEVDKEVS